MLVITICPFAVPTGSILRWNDFIINKIYQVKGEETKQKIFLFWCLPHGWVTCSLELNKGRFYNMKFYLIGPLTYWKVIVFGNL